jgi:polar amino acid transport system substrate-binding protein
MRLGVSLGVRGSIRLGTVRLLTAFAACVAAMVVSTPLGSAARLAVPGVDKQVAAEVPAAIKKKGMLLVAADATYAPNEYVAPNGTTIAGMDPDLAAALGAVMGLKVKMVNATFDSIIPGLQANKYDLGMSSFTDTKARQKVVDFVTYFSAGTSFYVAVTGGPAIGSLADLCGHTVAVERGTTQATDATTQAASCKKGGKPTVTVSVFPDQTSANLAIQSGHAQVGMADSPVAAFIVKQSQGRFKLSGKSYGTAPYGIAIPKGNGLDKPILDALKVLMKDGTYVSILTKWGIEQGAITNPKINGAIG